MNRSIQNFDALATNTLRIDALSIAEAGYAAINTGAALVRRVKIEDDKLQVDNFYYPLLGRKIFFVGIGKCAISAAAAIENIFEDRLTAGIALDVSSVPGVSLKKIESYIGTHPLPSETNEHATERILELLTGCTEEDLVIILISGGGSTLLCLPPDTMTCADEGALWSKLTAQGASIQEINTVRKHISRARGGGLAKAAYPAEVLSLIESDVPGNDIEFIASGPTVLDSSTVADAQAILKRYDSDLSTTVAYMETPKDEKYFDRVTNYLFLTNQDALKAMQEEATRRGYTATIMDDQISGESSTVGIALAETLHTLPSKTVLLYAGETTVTFKKTTTTTAQTEAKKLTQGGRNQEMALAALTEIHDDELMLPLASDGHDNTDHAGAIADATTRAHAAAQNLSVEDHLARHCSYDFFSTSGDALRTGYTESNVSDIIIAIKN